MYYLCIVKQFKGAGDTIKKAKTIMTTTTFQNKVRNLTNNFKYVELIKMITIEEFGKKTIAAIYSERKDESDKLHFRIYYAYDHMKKVYMMGYWKVENDGNAYIKACEELEKFL